MKILIVEPYFTGSHKQWAEGYKMKFGLYSVDFKTQERTLRKGSKTFVEIINRKGYDDRGFLVSIGDKTPNFTMNFSFPIKRIDPLVLKPLEFIRG